MKKNTGYIVLAVGGSIYILFNFMISTFVVAQDPGGAVSIGTTFLAEMVAFIPIALFFVIMQKIYPKKKALYTTFSLKSVRFHFLIFVLLIVIHAVWREYFNSVFFGIDFNFSIIKRDAIGFLNLRVLIYIITIGLIVGIAKIQEKENYLLQQSALRLKLQQAIFRELELKLNPEIIYPNLDFIKEHIYSQPAEASALVLNLSKQLRILLDGLHEEWVSVKKDLLFFEHYFDALQLRLHKQFCVKNRVDEEYLNFRIPSLVLLVPFLEDLFFGQYATFTRDVDTIIYHSKKTKAGHINFLLNIYPISQSKFSRQAIEVDKTLFKINNLLASYNGSCYTAFVMGHNLFINLKVAVDSDETFIQI